MRTILLLRHGQAASAAGVADHDRPLDDIGRDQAARVGGLIAERHGIPDQVRSSTARRARETVEGLLRAWPQPPPVVYDGQLYLASRDALLAAVASAPDAAQRLMLVGHNPGILGLAAGLASTRAAADRLAGLPPAGLAVLAVDGPWEAVTWRVADLVDVTLPER